MRKIINKKISKGFLLFLLGLFSVGVQGQYDENGSADDCYISDYMKAGPFDSNGDNEFGIHKESYVISYVNYSYKPASGWLYEVVFERHTEYTCKKQDTGSTWNPYAGAYDPLNPSGVGGGGAGTPPCTLQASYCISIGRVLANCACVEKPCAITSCPTGLKLVNCGCIKDCDITATAVNAAFNGNTSIVNGVSSAINKYGALLGIDSKLEVQHFLAQAALESGNFTSTKESTKYQTSVVMDNFGEFFNDIGDENKDRSLKNLSDFGTTTTKEGKTYVVNREALFNHIYNDQNRIKVGFSPIGNTQTGDGYLYIGRGAIQITGRDNYTAFNNWYNTNVDSSVDLVKNPQVLDTNKEIGTLASLWYFKNRVMDKLGGITDKTTVDQVTKKVNSAMLERKKRAENFEKAKKNIDC